MKNITYNPSSWNSIHEAYLRICKDMLPFESRWNPETLDESHKIMGTPNSGGYLIEEEEWHPGEVS